MFAKQIQFDCTWQIKNKTTLSFKSETIALAFKNRWHVLMSQICIFQSGLVQFVLQNIDLREFKLKSHDEIKSTFQIWLIVILIVYFTDVLMSPHYLDKHVDDSWKALLTYRLILLNCDTVWYKCNSSPHFLKSLDPVLCCRRPGSFFCSHLQSVFNHQVTNISGLKTGHLEGKNWIIFKIKCSIKTGQTHIW